MTAAGIPCRDGIDAMRARHAGGAWMPGFLEMIEKLFASFTSYRRGDAKAKDLLAYYIIYTAQYADGVRRETTETQAEATAP
jgi:hypothetical protein